MFYAWFGIALYMAGEPKNSYEYLRRALELGESSGNQKVVGYACTWLPWSCAELGLFVEGIEYGERAQKIAGLFPSDQYLYYKSLSGLCFIYNFQGQAGKVFSGAKLLLEHGEKTSNNRSVVFGHWVNSWGYQLTGDMKSAQHSNEKACEVALDKFYSLFPEVSLGFAYLWDGQFQKAQDALTSIIEFSKPRAIGELIEWSNLYLAPVLIAQGHMQQGLNIVKETQQSSLRNNSRVRYAFSEYILGKIYTQIATGPAPALSTMTKNIGFLVKNVPRAGKKAEKHFTRAIELSKELGAASLLGWAYLDLGLFYQTRKNIKRAKECLAEAIQIFEESAAEGYLKQAREAFELIED